MASVDQPDGAGMSTSSLKNLSLDDDYLLIAALDFGTTFSAYAYSFKCSPEDIYMNKNWGGTDGFESYKAPTSVLTKPGGEFDSFGYEAEEKFSRLEGNIGGQDGYNLYRNFKMLLHKQGAKMTSTVTSTSGHQTLALDIFIMALTYLKNHMLDAIRNSVVRPIEISDIRWVITVPAIWSDESKRFMRTAAYWANLIPEENSHKLMIVLEPEAASIFCRQLEVQNFVNVPDQNKVLNFRSEEKFLVIDAGGGTLDITAHEILFNGDVKEIARPTGGPYGGTQVDESFVSLISKALGKEFVKYYMKTHSEDWIRFLINFETKKKKCKKDNDIRLPLSWLMGKEYTKFTGTDIEQALSNTDADGISFSSTTGMIVVSKEKVQELFHGVVTKIIKLVKEMLKREKQLKGLNYIFLVGGFSECSMMQEECIKVLSSKAKVLVPISAQLAVLRGAVLFGHRPWQISSRIAKYTYGCQTEMPFIEGKHNPDKMRMVNGQKKCVDLFKVFVHRNDAVEVGKVKSFACKPAKEGEKVLKFTIYSTEKEDVTYVDEEGVQNLGYISLKSKHGSLSNDLEIRITFGFTELLIEAVDLKKGKTAAKTSVDFLAKNMAPAKYSSQKKHKEKEKIKEEFEGKVITAM